MLIIPPPRTRRVRLVTNALALPSLVSLLAAACTARDAGRSTTATSTTAASAAAAGAALSARPLDSALQRSAAHRAADDSRASPSNASEPTLGITSVGDSMRMEVLVDAGARINARLPPTIVTTDGRRLRFGAMGVSPDSAYFEGPVTLLLPRSALPVQGTLRTSYCLSNERLCRSAEFAVRIDARSAS